jgi:hypothetical protein
MARTEVSSPHGRLRRVIPAYLRGAGSGTARPILLNGIEDVISRPDLAERALFLTLPPSARRSSGRRPSFGTNSRPRARASWALCSTRRHMDWDVGGLGLPPPSAAANGGLHALGHRLRDRPLASWDIRAGLLARFIQSEG